MEHFIIMIVKLNFFLVVMHLFHEGEKKLQERMGLSQDISQEMEQYITKNMPKQHQVFFSELFYFIIGSIDTKGRYNHSS